MARRVGEPSSSRGARGKSVSPAVAVVVIVIVLAVVAAVWLKFTQAPPGAEGEGGLSLENLRPGALQTPEGQDAMKKVQEDYGAQRREKASAGRTSR